MVLENESPDDYNDTTTIKVTVYVWKRLNELKTPGDSFNTVIQRLLESHTTSQGE